MLAWRTCNTTGLLRTPKGHKRECRWAPGHVRLGSGSVGSSSMLQCALPAPGQWHGTQPVHWSLSLEGQVWPVPTRPATGEERQDGSARTEAQHGKLSGRRPRHAPTLSLQSGHMEVTH